LARPAALIFFRNQLPKISADKLEPVPLVKIEGIEFGHAGAVASKASVIIHDKVTLNA
jgi:hypothetical protein